VRVRHNQVIAALTPPPPGHWSEQLEGDVKDWYRRQFQPVAEPCESRQDVWLRYGREEDVEAWAEFLLPRLPRMLLEFETRAGA
jgi:hypothetical protein